MKTTRNFLLSLILTLTTVSVTFAMPSKAPASFTENKAVKFAKHQQTYQYFGFAYQVTSLGSGYYDVKVYFYGTESGTDDNVAVTASENITITSTTGPLIGTFTFPSGSSSVDLGTMYLGNVGTDPQVGIDCTTTPSTYDGENILTTMIPYDDVF
jgi:hypothetical protein